MKRRTQLVILILLLTVTPGWLMAQTYNDGPTQLRVKVRQIYVSRNIPADAGLNIGGQTIGFDPDEYTFYLGVQDNPNTSALPWQYPAAPNNPLLADFDPPGLSTDFNNIIFTHNYGSPVSPRYFSLRLDAWQDNCGSDGVSFLGINCGGNRNTFENTCTDFACGTLAGIGDNNRCNSPLFKDTINYRAAGPPCQWNSHGQVTGTCPSNNIYQPVMESFWRYTLGTACTPTDAIDLGALTVGGRLTHYNSNECYSNNFAASPGNDVFYKFTINSAIGVTIDLCGPRTLSTFDTYLYLLDGTCAIDTANDDNCGIQSRISKTLCSPGTYYIVVDGKTAGDFGPFEIVVAEDSNYTFSASTVVENPSCAGIADGKIKVEVNGGKSPYLYDWPAPLPDGLGLDSAGGLGGGNYSINVIDNDGCLTTATGILTDPAPLTVTVDSTNVTCGGINDGTATATPQGGTLPYQYVWNTTPIQLTGQTIINLAAGPYSVTVEDLRGCLVIGSTTVVPPPTAVSISASVKTDISCAGANDGAVDITVSNGTMPYTFSWSNLEDTEDVTGLPPGPINVVVTDITGCLATASFMITEPPLLVSSINNSDVKNVSCNGENDGTVAVGVNGGTQPYFYMWTLDGAPIGGSSFVVIDAEAGDYDVLVTDANGCTATSSRTVTEPAAITSSISKTNAGCNSGTGSADLTASGGTSPLTYQWSTQETTEDISNLTEGKYSVVITDANNCTKVDTVTITGATPLVIQSSVTRPSCFGFSDGSIEMEVIEGDEPVTFLWTGGSTTSSLTALTAGTYEVTITDASGCEEPRLFILEERGEEDCFSRATDFVAIPNAFSPNADGHNDHFDLYAEGTDRIEVQIFDRWGARVFYKSNQEPNEGNGWDGTINGKDAPTGTYVYLINIDFTDPKVTEEKQRTGTITLIR